ncbi:MAG TPA: DUF4157 domain-containing protein [Longimicrobium sp.]|nr:DUF4157 domain-containing protein [Longimicrobium sp.]
MLLRASADARAYGPAVAPPIVHQVLRSSGAPLDAGVRAEMEPRFRHSFADVRVHADGTAAESAKAVGAHAYAVGRDVVFGAGRYAPGSADGDRLIAHELAHVVQQRGSASASIQPKLEVGAADDAAERQADAAARAVTRGRPAHGLADGGGHALRRSPNAAPDPDAALAWWSWMMGMGDLEAPTSFERHGLPEVTQVGGIEITRKGFSAHGRVPIGSSAASAGVELDDGKVRPFAGADPQADDADTMSPRDLPVWLRAFLPSVTGAAPMPRMRAPRPLDPRQEGPREEGAPDQRNPWLRTPPHPPIGFGAAGLHFPLAHPASGIRRPWELP